MRLLNHLILLVILAALFHPSTGNSTNIISDLKDLLLSKGDELTNATKPDPNKNQTSSPLIPSHDIVEQIINLLNCGPFPLSPNSHLKYSWSHTTNNLQIHQTCKRYFQTTKNKESLQVQCKDDKWVFNEIVCEKTTCPRLTTPTNGYISTNVNIYNTTVYLWCSPGFGINGTDKLVCEESGRWNLPLPTCKVLYCHPLPPPRRGSVSSQAKIAVNQTVEFKCKDEYSLFGDAVLRCQDDGRWNTTAPVCKKMCTVPKLRKNNLESVHLVPSFRSLSFGSPIQQGQRVIFSCKAGYIVLVSGFSTCIGDTMRPPIRCRKGCDPVEIKHGKYSLSKDSSTIEYSCDSGYQLYGQQKLSCTPNITWDSEVPVCTRMCTLPDKEEEVLSFRRKETYEIIPFGTQIIDGSQVIFLCRSRDRQQISVTTCFEGYLFPPPCIARLVGGNLELYRGDRWYQVCDNPLETYTGRSYPDVCGLFGYRNNPNPNRSSCSRCHTLRKENSRINLNDRGSRCLSCLKKK